MVPGTRIFLCSLWQLGQAGARPLCFTSSTSGVSARSSSCCRDSVDSCCPWLREGQSSSVRSLVPTPFPDAPHPPAQPPPRSRAAHPHTLPTRHWGQPTVHQVSFHFHSVGNSHSAWGCPLPSGSRPPSEFMKKAHFPSALVKLEPVLGGPHFRTKRAIPRLSSASRSQLSHQALGNLASHQVPHPNLPTMYGKSGMLKMYRILCSTRHRLHFVGREEIGLP